MFVLTITVLLVIIQQSGAAMKATAVMYGDSSMTSYGTLTFTQENANTDVLITGTLTGLNISSAHGFHVHEFPITDGSPNCSAARSHFNPYGTTHGARTANITNRHVGDLGNLTTNANGEVTLNISDWIIQLYNATQSIINRTIVVHHHRDDGGQGGFPDSNATGNAGDRILCGLIKSEAFNLQPALSVFFLTISMIFIELF